jgi:NAD-dependent DNA ligase
MSGSCTCVADFNVKLREHNTRIVETIGIPRDGSAIYVRPSITTEKIETRKRGGPALVIPTFCPFCGTRYEPEPATRAIGEAA